MSLQLIVAALSYTGAKWIAAAATVAIFVVAVGLVAVSAPAKRTAAAQRTPAFLRVLVGADGRVSTSRTVAFAWTAVVVYILLGLIIANPASWSDALKNLSPTYLLLLGFPYASLVLAKATVATRVAGGTLAKPQSDQPGRLSQLFTDDSDTPDVFDVQYVVFNIVAMVFVVVAFGRAGLSTGFPAIPEGLLLLTGGPAAVYVSNKFMPGDAPQIFSVSPHTVRVGQSFTVLGQNLRASTPNADTPEVKVAGVPVPDGGTYSSTSLTAVAPDVGADLGRQVDVSVTSSAGVQTVVTDGLTVLGRVPVLDGADRGVAQVGEDVVLHGDWTADEASGITVLVDDDVVGTIVVPPKPAANTLTFAMPVLANLGGSRSVSVAVKLGTELSKSVSVLVSAPPPPQGNGVPEDAQTRSGVRV